MSPGDSFNTECEYILSTTQKLHFYCKFFDYPNTLGAACPQTPRGGWERRFLFVQKVKHYLSGDRHLNRR